MIEFLKTLDYGKLTDEMVRVHVDDLYLKIDGMNLEEIEKKYTWFPKKGAVH